MLQGGRKMLEGGGKMLQGGRKTTNMHKGVKGGQNRKIFFSTRHYSYRAT